METRASRGIVKGFSNPVPSFGVEPPNNYLAMERMWKRDEVIATAFDTTVDMVTRNGYDFVSSKENSSSKKEIERANLLFGDLNFDEVLKNLIYQMLAYGDAFLELRRTSGTVIDELHPLETTEMNIKHTQHGKVLGYIQKPRHSTIARQGTPTSVNFTPEGVIHMRLKWVGSQIYSQTPLEPISRIWATKQNAFNYLDQMFMNLRPELFVHLKGASKDQYDEAREVLWQSKVQPSRPVITYGSAESSTEVKEISANFGNTQGLFTVLEYLREAALMITRVPPVWVGLVNKDGANKGNSEAQIFSFETRVRRIQKDIENKINRLLLPQLGFKFLEFNFNPITFKSEKEAIQNAAVLSSINIKPIGIMRYLKRNGITDFNIEDFTTPEEMMAQMQSSEEGNQTARNKVSPSRESSDKMSVTNNMDQTGSSAAGAKKREEKSMKMRSMGNFKNYPYTYEVK